MSKLGKPPQKIIQNLKNTSLKDQFFSSNFNQILFIKSANYFGQHHINKSGNGVSPPHPQKTALKTKRNSNSLGLHTVPCLRAIDSQV